MPECCVYAGRLASLTIVVLTAHAIARHRPLDRWTEEREARLVAAEQPALLEEVAEPVPVPLALVSAAFENKELRHHQRCSNRDLRTPLPLRPNHHL